MVMRNGKKTLLHPDAPIPDKPYFKIGEASHLVGVEAHVLRYWEKEVPGIKPTKTSSNQRRYRRKDIEIFREVRRLLRDEKFTLAGVKRQLSQGVRPVLLVPSRGRIVAPARNSEPFFKVRKKLEELVAFCKSY